MNHKLRSILIILILLLSMIPVYYFYRYLKRLIDPSQSAARLFLFLLANFVMVIGYTLLLVGLIAKLFPLDHASSSF